MMYEIGNKIREARKELGLTQTEFAKKIGSTRSTVSDLEKGINKGGNFKLINSIAKISHKPISYFIDENSDFQMGIYDVMDSVFNDMIEKDLVDDDGDFDSEFNEKMLEIVKATLALKKERLIK